MKKLLCLFLAITVACSSDDSNSNSTFTEIYDGVVWKQEAVLPNGVFNSNNMAFYDSDKTIHSWGRIDDELECDPIYYLNGESDGISSNIILNSPNELILSIVSSEASSEMKFTVIENGQVLRWSVTGDSSFNSSYDISNDSNPCL
jgi:hypothetical protein